MAIEEIRVVGARTHNLKNVSVRLPRNRLIVITGPSGSGKSSLAFDTLYAEGQRRYVESLSTYARQFLDQFEKPDVDHIEGLSPAIAIEQRTTAGSPRSTIATTTEIYDYVRLLFTHLGVPHHPKTGKPLKRQTIQQLVDRILAAPEGTPVYLLAPLVDGEKGEFRDVMERMKRDGFIRARIDGKIVELEQVKNLEKNKKHQIDVLIDRFKMKADLRSRIQDSLETAIKIGNGIVRVLEGEAEWSAGTQAFDPETGDRFVDPTPSHFSFNSPQGACPSCHGIGVEALFDPELLVSNPDRTLEDMPVDAWRRSNAGIAAQYMHQLEAIAAHYKQPMDRAWKKCLPEFQKAVLEGSGDQPIPFTVSRKGQTAVVEKPFDGAVVQLTRLFDETDSESTRKRLRGFMTQQPCRVCGGARLKAESLAVTIEAPGGKPKNIHHFGRMPVSQALEWIQSLKLTESQSTILGEVIYEIKSRLGFLNSLGLGYLNLDRESGTLSGGEAQRIRLATQIGSKLTGVLYILDEPSIGLHQRDHDRLMDQLRALRDLGNTVLVVEHDEETMRAADYLVDLGPGAGVRGGQITAAGTVSEVLANPHSLTGQYLTGALSISVPKQRRKPGHQWLCVKGARENNLKGIDVRFPLGLFTCVTGVSGSGKSTLVNDILCRALHRKINRSGDKPGAHDALEGAEEVEKVIIIDQDPIGRTPRSNPVTYTGAFNVIRDLYTQLPTARVRGYGPSRFSFNVKGGRCEHCEGDGVKKIEMNFLPPVYVTCEVCHGKRFNRETLEITYKGVTIAEVLEMTVDDALAFFRSIPMIVDRLEPLAQVGLGYLKLGQPATTLSGGESQRIKLAAELGKRATGRTVYIMDEPTTGLHFSDIQQLLIVLQRLVASGSTLIVIEHQLDVIKSADWIIDLGPEGGDAGGTVVGCGTPEIIAAIPASYTGKYLKRYLN